MACTGLVSMKCNNLSAQYDFDKLDVVYQGDHISSPTFELIAKCGSKNPNKSFKFTAPDGVTEVTLAQYRRLVEQAAAGAGAGAVNTGRESRSKTTGSKSSDASHTSSEPSAKAAGLPPKRASGKVRGKGLEPVEEEEPSEEDEGCALAKKPEGKKEVKTQAVKSTPAGDLSGNPGGASGSGPSADATYALRSKMVLGKVGAADEEEEANKATEACGSGAQGLAGAKRKSHQVFGQEEDCGGMLAVEGQVTKKNSNKLPGGRIQAADKEAAAPEPNPLRQTKADPEKASKSGRAVNAATAAAAQAAEILGKLLHLHNQLLPGDCLNLFCVGDLEVHPPATTKRTTDAEDGTVCTTTKTTFRCAGNHWLSLITQTD